jgi:hypothetical protein
MVCQDTLRTNVFKVEFGKLTWQLITAAFSHTQQEALEKKQAKKGGGGGGGGGGDSVVEEENPSFEEEAGPGDST